MLIPEFFADQTLLVTGGTGFVGKVFVEKILRCCPDVRRIYVVARPKKGLSPEERWKQLTDVALFNKLRNENPLVLDKVTIIEGDLKYKNLGLSEDNMKMLIADVTLIYHNAATVQFNNNLIDTLKENLRSTYYLAQMALSMKRLKSFIYVSTTYSNFHRTEEDWKEQVYPSLHDWRVLLKLLDNEPLAMSSIKEKILGGRSNAYTMSKSLAENLLQEYSQFYPIIIVRPSIVSAVHKEPLPGWQDGLNGMASLSVGVALGVVRVIFGSVEDHQDYIPVDLVANTLALVAWKANEEKKINGLEVYNCTMGKTNIFPIKEFQRFLDTEYYVHSKMIIWKINFLAINNPTLFYIVFLLNTIIPFTLVDVFLRIAGSEPRLTKLAIKLQVTWNMLKIFIQRQFCFPNEKFLSLQSWLKKSDIQDFSVHPPKLHAMEEIQKSLTGILQYLYHEDLSEKCIKKNKERYNRILLIDTTIKIVFCSIITWCVVRWLSIPEYLGFH